MGFLELAKRKAREIEFERRNVVVVEEISLDDYWLKNILPRLSRLHIAGKLPALESCPLWRDVDRLWQEESPDVDKVKQAMSAALEAY